jgi:hypothetical protein
MGLLDFDDDKILAERSVPTDRPYRERRRFEDNFEDLQRMGREREQSADFEDSPFADRQKLHICPNGYHANSINPCECNQR